ncbi:MAG: site-specific integrase [bacterium]
MKKVEPIRDIDDIKKMKNILLKQNYRDYLLFSLGINTGFRISDILKLKVGDVKDQTHIEIKEEKTEKTKRQYINSIKKDIDKYIVDMEDHEYLFQSRKGNNKPISRVQAYRVLKKAADKLKIEKVGTHTLRKTFGYHHYQRNKDVAILQKLFNHSSPSITLEYIGISQDEQDRSMKDFYL